MKRHTKGFTLIELLISMSLLATIMLLGTWSFSVFTSKWEGSLGKFAENVSQAKDFILLNDIITTIAPYVYVKNGRGHYYFEGSEEEFKGVTLGSIFHPKSAVAFRIQVKQHIDGSYYLLYQEQELVVLSDPSDIEYTHEKILIEDAQSIRLTYLGWTTALEKINSEDSSATSMAAPQWRPAYNSEISSLMPIAIKIKWDESVTEVNLVNDQGQWLSILRNAGGINE